MTDPRCSDSPEALGAGKAVQSLRDEVATFHEQMQRKLNELEAAMTVQLDCLQMPGASEARQPEDIFAIKAIEPAVIVNRQQSGTWGLAEAETFRLHPSCIRVGATEGKSHLHGRWMELSTQLTSVLSASKPPRRGSNAVIEGSRSLTLTARVRERWLEKPFHPEGSFRVCWDTLALLLVMLDGFLTPVAIAWDIDTDSSPSFQVSFFCSFIFWFLDILLNFNTAVYVRGSLMYSRATIACQYLKTWLIFDLLLISLDCLTTLSSSVRELSALRVARLVRGLRLVRLLKMSRLHDMIQEVAASSGRQWIMLVIAIANTACRILMVAHILACIWIWIGRWVSDSQNVSWIDLSEATGLSIYVQWLHSLRYVINSPSPPAIAPNSATERVFDILAYVFSLLVIGSAISAIAGTLNDLRAMNEARARQRREVRLYLTSQNARYELVGRVMKFVDYKLEKMTSFNFDQSLISSTLYTELFVGQRGKFLSKLPIFALTLETFSDVFAHICTALQKHVYEKGELVFAAGAWAGSLHMTTAGVYVLSDVSRAEKEDRVLKGDEVHWFAELALYADSAIHVSTLRAKNIAEMFTLTGVTLVSAVRESPACSAMFCEYARDFVGKQRGISDEHDDQIRYAHACCQQNQYYQELHPDQRKQFSNIDILKARLPVELDLNHSFGHKMPEDAEVSRGKSESSDLEVVKSLMEDLASGSISSMTALSQQLQQLLPELHPFYGTYSVFEEGLDRARAESACISMLALLANRYDIYTNAQSSGKLLHLQWEQLQEIVSWAEPTERHAHAVLVLLAIRGLGKSKALLSQVPEQDQQPEKAVLYLMKEQRHIVPSVSKLDESGLALLQETLLHHEAFKLAQMLQGENVPASIADLQERFSRDSREAFQFYIFFLLGFMSGIAGGLGSKFMTARNADAVINGICMLQRLLDAKPLGIYWGYLNARAESLGWPCASAEDFALVRLACLSRLQDRDGYVALRQAWCTCGQQERARLLEHFLADGITERALVLEFLPDCISGAKNNKLVGLAVFLHVLVDLLANLSVALNSAPAMGGKKLIRVDLSDMSAFTVAVQNGFVFRTCISRCNFYVGDDKVQVQMTSENWSRTQDSETDITNLSHSMREVLLQQQAVMGHFSIEQAQPWFLSSTIPKNGVMEVSC